MQWTSGDVLWGAGILAVLGFVVAVLTKSLVATLTALGLAIVLDLVWQWTANDYDKWSNP